MNIKFLIAKISKASTVIDDVINKIGTTDISEIGDGTLSGAISTLNDLIEEIDTEIGDTDISSLGDGTITNALITLKEMIKLLPILDIKVVEELPTEDISTTTIYLVKSDKTVDPDDMYSEYLYVNGKWECLGTQKFDIQNYYTKEEVNNLIADIISDYYTKTEIDDNFYTKTEVDNKIIASAADDITEQEYVDIFNNTPPLDGANEEGF